MPAEGLVVSHHPFIQPRAHDEVSRCVTTRQRQVTGLRRVGASPRGESGGWALDDHADAEEVVDVGTAHAEHGGQHGGVVGAEVLRPRSGARSRRR